MTESNLVRCPSCGEKSADHATRCPYCGTSWDATIDELSLSETPAMHADAGSSDLPPRGDDERYSFLHELGAGGVGVVWLAYDRVLRRHVAYKVLHGAAIAATGGPRSGNTQEAAPGLALDPAKVERFVAECQAAAQLQHPAIVPIYDAGRRTDGSVYYTMKYVAGKTLKQHLSDMREGSPDPGITRYRLLQALHQVCLAISYMHRKGVLHRDLKPQNIMLGEFGEVLVLDFGLAKVLSPGISTVRSDVEAQTSEQQIQGTLAYMPPEQCEGADVDEASDQFALGAILYEILTYRPPYVAGRDMLRNVVNATFPRPRDIAPDAAAGLEEICLKAMAFKKYDRYRSAKELADALQEFLEGEKEIQRREALAAEALAEAREQLRRYEDFEREAASLDQQLVDLRATTDAEQRSRATRLQERARQMGRERDRAFREVVRRFVRTIDVSPDNRRAKEMLADLCYRKMIEMENLRRLAEMEYFRTLVESYHDGKYASQLQGDGVLSVRSDPAGAHVYVANYVEHGARLEPENERYLGSTPLSRIPLPMGSYLATLRAPDHPDTQCPFVIGRNESAALTVPLLKEGDIAPGFVYVPQGYFLRGGDPLHGDLRLDRVWLPGFCIGRNPVTMAEYLVFLNELRESHGLQSAAARVPRGNEPYFGCGDAGFFIPERDADGDVLSPDFPVFGISADDAEAYCAWRSSREGIPLRLPTSDEWEKAARGVDGRGYPWGDGWEDGLSHSATETSVPLPETVGRATDVSPFGVLGVAGNVKQWTSSLRPGTTQLRIIRGAAWSQAELMSHVAILAFTRPFIVDSGVGFRMAYTPPRLAQVAAEPS